MKAAEKLCFSAEIRDEVERGSSTKKSFRMFSSLNYVWHYRLYWG